MDYHNYFSWLEQTYKIDINKNLRDILTEHFGDNLRVYTDQELYEQHRIIIQSYNYTYFAINQHKYNLYL